MSIKQIQILAVSGVVLVIAVVALAMSVFVVDPTEQVIVTQFGKEVKIVVKEGLNFKIPFVQEVNRLDRRILEWDGEPTPMQTKDKLFIQVDTYARWRIDDPLEFFKALTDERTAHSRLNDILGGETLEVIAKNDLVEVIRTTKDRNPDSGAELVTTLAPIEFGRNILEEEIFKQASEAVTTLGIELLDLRFKRINYNDRGVIEGIYARMASERAQIAEKTRAEGDGEASKIQGTLEKELKRIQSEAYRTVQETKGEADAEATEIYASAYNQSPEAVEFYRFLKTMEVYKDILKQDTTVVLSTNSDLFEFLKGIDPESRKPVDFSDTALHPDREELPLFLRDN